MCGIVGYVGHRNAADFLLEGLRRLEYRGYDSAGVATLTPRREWAIRKTVGRIDTLAELLDRAPAPGTIGVGHTRWATHGPATQRNAHPHLGGDRVVAIGDLHGGYEPFVRILKESRLIDEDGAWADPRACLVQLGDVADRGGRPRLIYERIMERVAGMG